MGQLTRTNFGLVTVTVWGDEEIKNFPVTTPTVVKEIVAAPSQFSNNIIVPVICIWHFDPWFADYSNISDGSTIGLDTPGGVWISQGLFVNTAVVLAPGVSNYTAQGLSIAAVNPTTSFQGPLIQVTSNTGGRFTGGDPRNKLRLKVFYLAS